MLFHFMSMHHSCLPWTLSRRLDDMVARLEAGNYTVPVTAAFQRCREQLPWWRSDTFH